MNASRKLLFFVSRTRTLLKGHYPRLIQGHRRCMATNVSIFKTGNEKETFQDVLPGIIDSLIANPKFSELPEVGSWIKTVLDYNLTGGKKTRGLATVFAYEMLEKPVNITEDSLRLARTLGWCIEMLQAYFLVVDDIIDGSSTRRGMPCWYQMPNVGLGAINDSILISSSIFEILKTYFMDTPHYIRIVHLFNEILFYTSMGQHLDYTMAHRNKNDYSLFTIERYNAIVKHKTAYYTFKLPIVLGLLLANNVDKQLHKDIEVICLEMGRLFQIQDDFIDCFGDETVSGKAGTDIQEGKCSWLAVTALQRCSDLQRAVFIEHYGKKEAEHVDRIKRLYEEMQIPQLYAQEERVLYDSIVKKSNALNSETAPTLFLKLLNMLYKRKR